VNEPESMRDLSLERPLPSSVESERLILGCVFLDNSLMSQALALLKPEDFYIPSHRRIFLAMIALVESDSEITPQLLGEALKRDNALESCGGMSFLSQLTSGIIPTTNLRSYARVIKGKSLLRGLIKMFAKASAICLEEEDEPQVILSQIESEFMAVVRESAKEEKRGARSFAEISERVKTEFSLWRSGRTTALRTGIPELDSKLKFGGFAKGDLIYIGARASIGKTALALQIAKAIAKRNHRALFFSLEMDEIALFLRSISSEGGVENWKLRPDMFGFGETLDRVTEAFPLLAGLPLYIDDSARELSHIEAVSRDFVRNQGGEIIFIDYQQLMEVILKRRSSGRHEEVAEASKRLKALARTLGVPLVATSQLKPGTTADKFNPDTYTRRPELEDLRESGQLGMDADLVLFPYPLNRDDHDKDIRRMGLYCPKQRNGKRGWEVEIDFWAHYQRFYTRQMLNDEQFEKDNPDDLAFAAAEREAIAVQELAPEAAATFDFGNFDESEFVEDEEIRNG
jgi:replicative DNA helicase